MQRHALKEGTTNGRQTPVSLPTSALAGDICSGEQMIEHYNLDHCQMKTAFIFRTPVKIVYIFTKIIGWVWENVVFRVFWVFLFFCGFFSLSLTLFITNSLLYMCFISPIFTFATLCQLFIFWVYIFSLFFHNFHVSLYILQLTASLSSLPWGFFSSHIYIW